MTAIRIILAILACIGMLFLAFELDKNKALRCTYIAMCVVGIAACGFILGLCLVLLFG